MLPRLVDHRHQDGVVGGMRAAVVRRIMQKRVPALQHRVKLLHRPRHHVRTAQHMDRQALSGHQQLAMSRDDTAGEVLGTVEHALAALAERRGAAHIVTLHDISRLGPADFASTGEVRARLGIDGPIVMYAGNLEKYQGVDLLIEAFAIVHSHRHDVALVIAGGVPEHVRYYQRLTKRLGIDRVVHFLGPWPVERLGELLAEADILAAPRIKGLNTPMKIFPYLHSGRPVVATDLFTHNQILTPDVAALARPTPEGFARSLLALVEDVQSRQLLGAAGRKFVETNHTYAAHQDRVNALYDYLESVPDGSGAVSGRPSATAPSASRFDTER